MFFSLNKSVQFSSVQFRPSPNNLVLGNSHAVVILSEITEKQCAKESYLTPQRKFDQYAR